MTLSSVLGIFWMRCYKYHYTRWTGDQRLWVEMCRLPPRTGEREQNDLKRIRDGQERIETDIFPPSRNDCPLIVALPWLFVS